MSEEFTDNDVEYLDWLATHQDGFVINSPRGFSPSYMVLHRASCGRISNYTKMARPGGFTERDYVKICAKQWMSSGAGYAHGRPDGSFTASALCKPE